MDEKSQVQALDRAQPSLPMRMDSVVAVHTKGLGCSLWASRNSSILPIRSGLPE